MFSFFKYHFVLSHKVYEAVVGVSVIKAFSLPQLISLFCVCVGGGGASFIPNVVSLHFVFDFFYVSQHFPHNVSVPV